MKWGNVKGPWMVAGGRRLRIRIMCVMFWNSSAQVLELRGRADSTSRMQPPGGAIGNISGKAPFSHWEPANPLFLEENNACLLVNGEDMRAYYIFLCAVCAL